MIDGYDQDIAFVIGQGARAGLYQSIMMKPPNVRYVYPMTPDFSEVEMPEHLKDKASIIIFKIESERPDDLMHDLVHLEKLLGQIKETL